MLGLERAPLGGREPVVGQTPGRELRERRADPRQALAELRSERAADGLRVRRPHDA